MVASAAIIFQSFLLTMLSVLSVTKKGIEILLRAMPIGLSVFPFILFFFSSCILKLCYEIHTYLQILQLPMDHTQTFLCFPIIKGPSSSPAVFLILKFGLNNS